MIGQNTSLNLTAITTNANCNNMGGTATVIVTNGTPPFVYQWDPPSAGTDSIATNLSAGIYNVTVTDTINGCIDSIMITVGIDTNLGRK